MFTECALCEDDKENILPSKELRVEQEAAALWTKRSGRSAEHAVGGQIEATFFHQREGGGEEEREELKSSRGLNAESLQVPGAKLQIHLQ